MYNVNVVELEVEDDQRDKEMTKDRLEKFTEEYEAMTPERKWTLSTGNPSHSYIIDPGDENYRKYGIFTEEELQELKSFNPVRFQPLPDDLVNFLLQFGKNTTRDLRQACAENCQWYAALDREQHFHYDWIRRSVDTLIAEYESGNLEVQQNENWYMGRIWTIVNRVFDDLDGLQTIR
ncbi:hypothetical protein Unana1_07799 [Umbelopsis nana]